MYCESNFREDMSKDIMKSKELRKEILDYYKAAGIVLTKKEKNMLEVADFGLNDYRKIGLALVTYVNTDRVCAKELVLLPNQICPQHKHPFINNKTNKEETFRCRAGEVYLYVEGEESRNIKGIIPEEYKSKFTVFNEKVLKPGDQYTLKPDTWHWFQGGKEGAVISEFSTHSDDAADIFYDRDIKRL